VNPKKSEKIRRAYNPKRLDWIRVYKRKELRGNIEDVDLINSKIQNKKNMQTFYLSISALFLSNWIEFERLWLRTENLRAIWEQFGFERCRFVRFRERISRVL